MKTWPACGTPPVPGLVTVTTAVPVFPSLVARIVAVPALTAVTSPLALTVATDAESEDQAIVRPVRTLPAESRVEAARCSVSPTWIPAELGLTVTEATGTGGGGVTGVTVIAAVPLFPSLVARIVAEPAATPVTTPFEFTVATAPESDDHVIVRPERGLPAESHGVAVRRTVSPTWIPAELGATVTEATRIGVTVTADVSASEPFVWRAITRKLPAVCPAV